MFYKNIGNLSNSNKIPSDYNVVSGYIFVVESIYFSEPSFFKDSLAYKELINNLSQCKESNDINLF